MPKIDHHFRKMLSMEGSDLHLLQGQLPKVRQHGHVVALEGEALLTGELLEELLHEICPPRRWHQYLKTGDVDFAYAMGAEARFRCNYYRQHTGHAAVFRVIPTEIKSLDDLKAPPILAEIVEARTGLILVTGPTGSGKSTTLAAMVNHLNTNYARKILTLEKPIEFVHTPRRSVIVQREVGEHTESFAAGLRAGMREDCNVILVGEMRDLETISLAVSGAETGVLVMGTLHTNSAAKTLDRVVNAFPVNQQEQIRSMLSTSLRAVVSQQLLRRSDGGGRVAVHEILIRNTAAAAAIREGKISKLNQVIQTGKRYGMVGLDDALMGLIRDGVVSVEDAYLKAINKAQFEPLLGNTNPFASAKFSRSALSKQQGKQTKKKR